MLDGGRKNVDLPVLLCLHYLGGSVHEWADVAAHLAGKVRCVALDLPGFGAAAQTPGYDIASMAATVAQAVVEEAPQRWLLAGHSMGAKVAAVVARSLEDGTRTQAGFEGLVLLAGSPPSPEPMDEQQRATMLSWFADSAASDAEARRYIADNSGALLTAAWAEQAVADVLHANRSAWTAWLEHGSREDWSERVGVLQTPTLLIAGENDENLGAHAQRDLMAPHFAHVRLETLAGAKHLLPMECAQDVARLIGEHVASIDRERERATASRADYDALIASDRVSSGTRRALVARERPDDANYEPAALDVDALATLRAMLLRVVPQVTSPPIDLAARIDRQLAAGVGDGWRFAELPPDAQAYRIGLLTLSEAARRQHGQNFAALDTVRQDELLTRTAAGQLVSASDDAAQAAEFSAKQMQLWFADVRADAVKIYLGHPQTLARMGYSGIANGGDGEPKSGFVRVGIGELEEWEPVALTGPEA